MRTYEEQICQAVDVIAQEKIDSANFDRTIEARILSCEDSLTGKYRIKYQNSTFIAYSGDSATTYEEGTFVYVLIPGNDPEKDKLILWAGAEYSGRDTEQSTYSGWYGSGVGRFTNPEKNSELFNDYKNSKVDIKAQYCHIEGENHTINQYGHNISHTHVGGYQNTVSGKDYNCFASFIYGSKCNCSGADHSFIFGMDHNIIKSSGVNVFGLNNFVKNTFNNFIFGKDLTVNLSSDSRSATTHPCNAILGFGSRVGLNKPVPNSPPPVEDENVYKFDFNFLTGLSHTILNNVSCSAVFGEGQKFLAQTIYENPYKGKQIVKGQVGYSIISGLSNYIYSSAGDFVHGFNNVCNTSAGSSTHRIDGCNFLLGYFNYAEATKNTEFLGMSNAASGMLLNSFISGMQNKVKNGNGNIINGWKNLTENSTYSIMSGMENTIHTESSLVVGGRHCGNESFGLFYGDSISEDEYLNIVVLFSYGLWYCKEQIEDDDSEAVWKEGYKYTGTDIVKIPAGDVFKERKYLYPEEDGEVLVWDRNVISSEDYEKIKNNYLYKVTDNFKASYFQKTRKDENSNEYIYILKEAPVPSNLQYLDTKPTTSLKDSSFWTDKNLDNSHSIKYSIISGYENHFIGDCSTLKSGIFGQKNHFYGNVESCIIGGFSNHITGINNHSLIIGQENIIKGITYSIVFGFDNQANNNFDYPILLGGQKNKVDDSKCYLMVLGNGGKLPGDAEGTMRYGERSNAFAVDIDGNVYCKSIRKMPLSGEDTPGVDLSIYYTKEESDKIFGNISCGIDFPIIAEKTLGDIFFLEEEVSNIDPDTSEEIIENTYKEPYICTPKGWEKLFYDDTNKITYKGIVEKIENLPSEDNKIGDLYLIKKYKTSSNEEEQEFLCYMEYLFTENGWEPIFYQEEEDTRILLQLKGSLQNESELIALTNNQEGDSYFIFEKTEEENIPVAYQYIYFNSQWIKIGGKNIDEITTNKAIEELNKEIDTINNNIKVLQTNITENNEAINNTITNINNTLLEMQQDLANNNNNIGSINATLDEFNTRITELEDNSVPEQETIYLTNIDFTETGFTLTNSLSQTQSCTIEEKVEGNKNIITITNTTTGAVLTITQPISSSSANSE